MRKFTKKGLMLAALLGALTVSGCATRKFESPDAVVLQDPLPGQALVYLLRAPYDGMGLEVQSNGKRLAKLPSEYYTVLSLPPGKHQLLTVSTSRLSSSEPAVEPLELSLQPNQRVFYIVSGTTERSVGLAGVIRVAGGGAVPLFLPENTVTPNSRKWRECTELDARGLITISQLVLPERQ